VGPGLQVNPAAPVLTHYYFYLLRRNCLKDIICYLSSQRLSEGSLIGTRFDKGLWRE